MHVHNNVGTRDQCIARRKLAQDICVCQHSENAMLGVLNRAPRIAKRRMHVPVCVFTHVRVYMHAGICANTTQPHADTPHHKPPQLTYTERRSRVRTQHPKHRAATNAHVAAELHVEKSLAVRRRTTQTLTSVSVHHHTEHYTQSNVRFEFCVHHSA